MPFLTENLKAGYHFNPLRYMALDVRNLFDCKANVIEYLRSSCTRLEGAACNNGEGFDGGLIRPTEPRTLRLSLRASFRSPFPVCRYN